MFEIHYGVFFLMTILAYLLLRRRFKHLPGYIHGLFVLYVVSFLVFMVVFAMDHTSMSHEGDYDYIIILGAGLKDKTIQPVLEHRLEKAFEAAQVNGTSRLILSGGLGNGDQPSEAEAMTRYLIDQGLDHERLIPDDQSTSTWENLINSQEILEGRGAQKAKVLVVSSNFHLFRAGILARRLDFNIDTLSAKVDLYDKLDDYPREYYALIKSILFDWSKRIRIS